MYRKSNKQLNSIKKAIPIILFVVLSLGLSACTGNRQANTVVGAGTGAVGGGLIGNAVGGSTGAIIGGTAGAVGGAYVGNRYGT